MLPTENTARDFRQDFAFAIGLSLVIATALYILGAVLRSYAVSDASGRQQLEIIGQGGANVVTAGLMLAAVAALLTLAPERSERARPVLIATLVVSGVIVLLSMFVVVDVLTVHAPSAESRESFLLSRGSFNDRFALVLPQVGGLFMALVAMVGANRLGNLVSGSRGSADSPPG